VIYFASPVFLLLVVPLGVLLLYALIKFANPPQFNPPSIRFYSKINKRELSMKFGLGLDVWLLFSIAFMSIITLSEPVVYVVNHIISFNAFCMAYCLIASLCWLFVDFTMVYKNKEQLRQFKLLVPRVPID